MMRVTCVVCDDLCVPMLFDFLMLVHWSDPQAELLHRSPVKVGAVVMLNVPHSVIVEVFCPVKEEEF